MKEYHYRGLVDTVLIIEAESREEADAQLAVMSEEGWHRLGEAIGVSDVEFEAEYDPS